MRTHPSLYATRYNIRCEVCGDHPEIDRAHRIEVMVFGKIVHAWACSASCALLVLAAYANQPEDSSA